MSKPSQLRILITRFPYESVLSGEEWHTITLAEKLRDLGHKVVFMGSCQVFLKELPKRSFETIEAHGGFVPVSSKNLLLFLLTFPYYFVTWSLRLWRLKGKFGLTSIYMHSLSEKVLLTPTALCLGLRVVWVEHQRWGKWMFGNPLRFVYKYWSQFVKIIAVGPAYRDGFKYLGISEQRVHIITNGIDLQVFTPKVPPLPLGATGFHMGTIARLSVDKGVDILLEAFAKLLFHMKHKDNTLPDLHLHIIGEGPLKEDLEKRSLELGLKEHVHLYVPYRTIPREDTPRFIRGLDTFILASALPDPFGLVVAESLAVGTPTIVSDMCGIHYQLRHNHDALIVHGSDEKALLEAMTTLYTESHVRETLRKNSRSTAEKEFSLDTMVDRYVELLG